MSDLVLRINKFFRVATKNEVNSVIDQLVLTDRQRTILTMFYIQKQSIDYIADEIGFCSNVVDRELQTIRKKLDPIIP